MTPKAVQFVSLGPGDPELITLQSLHALQSADCIFCPATLCRERGWLSRSADILRQLHIPEEAIRPFLLPMQKERTAAWSAYEEVYGQVRQLYEAGRRVCVVAEGDAGLYSSIHYVLERLQADGIPVLQLAGVPAFVASGARAALHLVSQEERLVVCPGNATADELERFTADAYTVVVMKLPQCADEVKRFLAAPPCVDVHYFEHTGMADECYLTDPYRICERHFPYFSLLIVKSQNRN